MKTQAAFRHDPTVQVLLATDAAGEGINLQRAHLMVNYACRGTRTASSSASGASTASVRRRCATCGTQSPRRPARARSTARCSRSWMRRGRRSEVRSSMSLARWSSRAGRCANSWSKAVRYGEQPDVRARLTQVVANAFDQAKLRDLLEERALVRDAMDASRVCRIREEMERAEARRLQPHYIELFFLEAFKRLGGTIRQREPRRLEVTHVPAPIRNRDRLIGMGEPVLPRYEPGTRQRRPKHASCSRPISKMPKRRSPRL